MVRLTIPGPPPRKNERHRIVSPKGKPAFLVNSDAFDLFVLAVTKVWREAGSPRITEGAWSITIRAFWPTLRHLDVDMPRGDLDAPVSAVLDALQMSGVIDDDVRFVSGAMSKAHDKARPRTEVIIERVDLTP